MNRGQRFRGNRTERPAGESKPVADVDENNPIVKSFRQYATELNDKHDRYERIIKQSRDITIESKRLIFLLHTIDGRKTTNQKTLDEANGRLTNLCTVNFAAIAKELAGLDPYQYARAYSAGLQEFVEAYTFYDYLAGSERIMDWNVLQEKLTFSVREGDSGGKEIDRNDGAIVDADKVTKITCLVQPMEFMLGLSDLGGEIMRKCINSLGSGDIQGCYDTCGFLQKMFSGYDNIRIRKSSIILVQELL